MTVDQVIALIGRRANENKELERVQRLHGLKVNANMASYAASELHKLESEIRAQMAKEN